MTASRLVLGQTLEFTADPFTVPATEAVRHHRHGAVAIDKARVVAVGPAERLKGQYPGAEIEDMGQALLSPGFIDAHAHYPQTAIIASWGLRLIDWLNTYTFPEELRFGDPAYAAEVAGRYLDLVLANGTTTVASYCTSHPESVDAFFGEADRRGLRAYAGKTCMDRNAPAGLLDTPTSAYDDSKALIGRWHGRGRLSYIVTPRFSPTSSREQLSALGALWSEHPDCLMQTHISEQVDEVKWVAELFPEARDYLDTYEAAGLLGEGGLFGHAIHLTPRERARLREVGAALVHCPTSNLFIGSGLFDMAGLKGEGHRVALATDTGGGSSFSMLRTMAAAYEVSQLKGAPLHPAQLWWLATGASAEALGAAGRIGALAAGAEADLIAIDLASTPAIAQRHARAKDIWDALFPTIMMGDERAISAVWIAGERVRQP